MDGADMVMCYGHGFFIARFPISLVDLLNHSIRDRLLPSVVPLTMDSSTSASVTVTFLLSCIMLTDKSER